jgi:polyphosphate kinase
MRRRTSDPAPVKPTAPIELPVSIDEITANQFYPPLPVDPVAPKTEVFPFPPDLFINRELSWLAFNARVLEEAEDRSLPLLERAKFAAIFASNLDEFFMIRVAGVKRKIIAGRDDVGPDGRTPEQQALAIQASTQLLVERHAALIKGELVPALAEAGIQIHNWNELNDAERKLLREQFEHDIFPVLTPQAVDSARRFPHVSNQSLNLLVVLRSPVAGFRFARVKIPAVFPRLLPVGDSADETEPRTYRFVWIEQVIAAHLSRLFPGNDVVASYPFHVIRDSDIDLDEDEDDIRDLLVTMTEFLQQRSFGSVVQLVTDYQMPADVRGWLIDQLHADERDAYVIDGPMAAESLFELMKLDRPDLKDDPFQPTQTTISSLLSTSSEEGEAEEEIDIFAILRERDILLHHPYQSFSIFADFLKYASRDKHVVAIKQTLYRIGRDSPLVPSLVEARDDDTQVAVLVEVKARFDEENNISLARKLEEKGVHVAYGVHGLKTHCKATLVVRQEPDGTRRYVHLSTGNYNASTAKIYEDLAIFTANEEISSDVSELFNVLTGFSLQSDYRKLLVAPSSLRSEILRRIDRETERHQETGQGRIIFKMNSLVDKESIAALYRASQAGVQIDLIIRGICCLRPGVEGWSENIRVTSIVGRFLEHSRIYYFHNGGEEEIYLGSADLMERNLDKRVEVVFPVEDAKIRQHIYEEVLPGYLRDSVNARELNADGEWLARRPSEGVEPFDSQVWGMEHYSQVGG